MVVAVMNLIEIVNEIVLNYILFMFLMLITHENVFVFYVVKISGIKAKINLFSVDSFYNLNSS